MLSTALPETGEKSSSKSRFSSEDSSVRNNADAAIAPLLARANLLKQRGQWEESVAVCAEAIRRTPDSSAAHALLGDIYLAQGKNRDALHWYRMALDRDPRQSGLVEKHDRLLAEQRAVATGGFSATHLGGANKTLIPGELRSSENRTARLPVNATPVLAPRTPGRSTNRITVERTLDWIDRLFPQTGNPGIPRALFVFTGILTALVLAVGVFLFFAFRKGDVQDEQGNVLSEVRPVNNIPALNIPPTLAPATAGTVPPTVTPSAPSSPRAVTLLETLSSLNNGEVTVTAAQSDPGRGQAQLEIALAPQPGEPVQATRQRILQTSAKISQAAFSALPTLQRFSVRVLLRGNGSTGSADAVNANLVFVGETSSIGLRTLGAASSSPDPTLLSALFTNTWWASNLTVRMP